MLNNIIAMGNKKNKKNPNANCGKYHKKRVPEPATPLMASVKANNEVDATTGCRVINLHSSIALAESDQPCSYLPGLY